MYKIFKIDEDTYQIHSSFGEKSMEGTRLSIMVYAIHVLGFKAEDIEIGMLDLIRTDNDALDYGINRTFLFSYKRKDKRAA